VLLSGVDASLELVEGLRVVLGSAGIERLLMVVLSSQEARLLDWIPTGEVSKVLSGRPSAWVVLVLEVVASVMLTKQLTKLTSLELIEVQVAVLSVHMGLSPRCSLRLAKFPFLFDRTLDR
jgi:hypothetical protein